LLSFSSSHYLRDLHSFPTRRSSDLPDAVGELRRAVKELGFLGAMIPSNGLTRHVSHAEHWPIYEEAEKLNCIMAVHGGSYINLGFNTYTVFPATRALGMPFPLAIAL